MNSNKLLKCVEKDLSRETELIKAKTIIDKFKSRGGRGIPTVLVNAAVRTLYENTRRQTRKKEQKVTKRISKYADRIDENATALNDLLNDVMFDTDNILQCLTINDIITPHADETEAREEETEYDVFCLGDLIRQHKQETAVKQTRGRGIWAEDAPIVLPEIPTDIPSDDDSGGGGGYEETGTLPGV